MLKGGAMWSDSNDSHVRFTPIREMLSRRGFMGSIGLSLGSIALSSLLGDDLHAEHQDRFNVLPKQPHFAPKAKRVILLFQNGGPSQVDLFDAKPGLSKRHGQEPGEGYVNTVDVKKTGTWLGSPFKFTKNGQCGMELSELLPGVGKHADQIALIRSMVTQHSNHEQAIWNFNTGNIQPGRPAMGSWVVYGLGGENQNLPGYVAILHPKGLPVDGVRNFSSGWMPPLYQGMAMRAEGTPVIHLEPHGNPGAARVRLDLIQEFNRSHLEQRKDQLELEARIAAFELAARMQIEATSALDLSQESTATHAMYGTDNNVSAIHGRQCLLARRLIEHGVRFVQVLQSGQPWDTHKNNEQKLRRICARTDQPTGALLTDLKQRGLLDDTLVIWAGEFGRTPMAEGKDGRDHHKFGFSLWMAGGGVKGGVTHGSTDEFGYHAVEEPVTIPDFHATVLHLLGMDHERLTFRHGARDERLTDEHQAKVVRAVMA